MDNEIEKTTGEQLEERPVSNFYVLKVRIFSSLFSGEILTKKIDF